MGFVICLLGEMHISPLTSLKMKILLFFIVMFGVSNTGFAQPQTSRLILMMDPDILPLMCWSRDRGEIRDTSLLSVRYRMVYKPDSDSDRKVTNDMILQIGRVWNKYYSLVREDYDINGQRFRAMNTQLGVPAMPAERSKQDTRGYKSINGEFWIDHATQTITARYHSLRNYDESIEYKDPIPDFDWMLHDDTLTVCEKYGCMKATTRFRGREWSVWYTTEIPLNAGPWKFCGLPGLILRVEDESGDYRWDCVGLGSAPEELIYYRTATVTQTTREKYRLHLKSYHENPLWFLSEGEKKLQVRTRDRMLDETWTVPYNPIELE